MADFVGLLRKTIDAQSQMTPQLRQRIYERARATVERKLADSSAPIGMIELQRGILEQAIEEVESYYRSFEGEPVYETPHDTDDFTAPILNDEPTVLPEEEAENIPEEVTDIPPVPQRDMRHNSTFQGIDTPAIDENADQADNRNLLPYDGGFSPFASEDNFVHQPDDTFQRPSSRPFHDNSAPESPAADDYPAQRHVQNYDDENVENDYVGPVLHERLHTEHHTVFDETPSHLDNSDDNRNHDDDHSDHGFSPFDDNPLKGLVDPQSAAERVREELKQNLPSLASMMHSDKEPGNEADHEEQQQPLHEAQEEKKTQAVEGPQSYLSDIPEPLTFDGTIPNAEEEPVEDAVIVEESHGRADTITYESPSSFEEHSPVYQADDAASTVAPVDQPNIQPSVAIPAAQPSPVIEEPKPSDTYVSDLQQARVAAGDTFSNESTQPQETHSQRPEVPSLPEEALAPELPPHVAAPKPVITSIQQIDSDIKAYVAPVSQPEKRQEQPTPGLRAQDIIEGTRPMPHAINKVPPATPQSDSNAGEKKPTPPDARLSGVSSSLAPNVTRPASGVTSSTASSTVEKTVTQASITPRQPDASTTPAKPVVPPVIKADKSDTEKTPNTKPDTGNIKSDVSSSEAKQQPSVAADKKLAARPQEDYVLLEPIAPDVSGEKRRESVNGLKAESSNLDQMGIDNNFDLVSDIFAQAAKRERNRSGKKRVIVALLISIIVLAILIGIAWFVMELMRNDKAERAAVPPVVGENAEGSAAKSDLSTKLTQRLMPDGQEINPGPDRAAHSLGEGISSAEATPPAASAGEALFYENQTPILPASVSKGTVSWSLNREKTKNGAPDELVVHGDIQIPDKDLVLRMNIRRNTDPSIPANYLIELIFVLPENFDGDAIDSISPLFFMATEESTGQELPGSMPVKIGDNFFIIVINTPRTFDRNLNMMRQLPWLKLGVVYKNGRAAEFLIAKDSQGENVFKQVLDDWAQKESWVAPTTDGMSGNNGNAPSGNTHQNDNSATNNQSRPTIN